MPRARLLKPGFFTNDALGEVEPLGRLLFAGLWCLADREGRLHDRPRRIKAEVLPYDDVDVDRLLGELATRSFLIRYEVAGERFIQVAAFSRHQKPHYKEPSSTIPPCSAHASAKHPRIIGRSSGNDDPITEPDDAGRSSSAGSGSESITEPDGAEREPIMGEPSANQIASCSPLTLNQIQKPIPEAEADPGPPAEDPVPLLLRHWERATGTTVTPALADWLDAELGEGTAAEWLRDAISETGANGSKAWKYTKAIIERWRLHGREPRARSEQRQPAGRPARGRAEEPCRVTGKPHDWPNLPGWCERCNAQEPITEDSLRRRGLLVE